MQLNITDVDDNDTYSLIITHIINNSCLWWRAEIEYSLIVIAVYNVIDL